MMNHAGDHQEKDNSHTRQPSEEARVGFVACTLFTGDTIFQSAVGSGWQRSCTCIGHPRSTLPKSTLSSTTIVWRALGILGRTSPIGTISCMSSIRLQGNPRLAYGKS
eukprot:546916-Amphidinium_carterae.1